MYKTNYKCTCCILQLGYIVPLIHISIVTFGSLETRRLFCVSEIYATKHSTVNVLISLKRIYYLAVLPGKWSPTQSHSWKAMIPQFYCPNPTIWITGEYAYSLKKQKRCLTSLIQFTFQIIRESVTASHVSASVGRTSIETRNDRPEWNQHFQRTFIKASIIQHRRILLEETAKEWNVHSCCY